MTNALSTLTAVTLLTNPVPVEVIPISDGKIVKLAIVRRYVTTITNDSDVIWQTNDVLKGYALHQYERVVTWKEVPLSNPDRTAPSLPFSPGSVRQP